MNNSMVKELNLPSELLKNPHPDQKLSHIEDHLLSNNKSPIAFKPFISYIIKIYA